MSHEYELVCTSTGESLMLGKWSGTGFTGIPVPGRPGETQPDEVAWKVLERFLIRNRGQELRLLSSDWVLRWLEQKEGTPLVEICDASRYLNEPVMPEPDIEADGAQVPPDVEVRLNRLPVEPEEYRTRFAGRRTPADELS